MTSKPDYGFDAPGVVRNLFVIGLACVLLGGWFRSVHIGNVVLRLRPMLFSIGFVLLGQALLMFLYVRVGKFVHRDRLLGSIAWTGTEKVLDVGTGRGLLLIGAARRLTTGHATGIDIWSKDDMAGNSIEATYRNVEIEGVRAKVELRSENACKMSFPDGAFEVVLSNLCLHNIRDDAARKSACLEIARVLAPGGVALLSDFRHTAQYQRVLESTGLVTCRSAPAIWYTFPPLRTVRAQKPLG